MRLAIRIASIVLIAAGIWWTVGALARGYMVASGKVEAGEAIYANEIAPTLDQDYFAGAEGLVMLVLGGLLFSRSKQKADAPA